MPWVSLLPHLVSSLEARTQENEIHLALNVARTAILLQHQQVALAQRMASPICGSSADGFVV